ncbi:response regulator [Celeribacter sp. ULVN23_4]
MKQDVKKLFGGPPSIILVEDDDGDAKALTRAFAKAGVKNQIIRVWDGAEALDFLRGENSTPPACYVVLLDINMPRMSGHEFIRELRKDPLLRASTVFVMSTSNDRRDKIAAYRGNVAGYILKTKTSDDLMNVVELLERYLRVVQLPDLSSVE